MRVRAPAVAVLALLAAVAVLLIAGAPVAADHAYSHRYVILGRVIDALEQPAMGWTASASFTGVTPGDCDPGHAPPNAPTTTAYGDFFLCSHVHAFSGGTVTVSGPSYTQTFSLDVNLRKTVVNIRLPGDPWATKDPSAVATFHTQYTVRGRVWQPGPGSNVEGIAVNGVALTNEPVSVHTIFNSNTERGATPTTNSYGDYSTTLPLGSALTGGIVHVTSRGVAVSEAGITLDPRFMVSDVDVIVPAPPNPVGEWLSQYWWALVAPVAVVAGTWYVLPRIRGARKASRDVKRIPGIGRSKAQKLRAAGAGTIERLAEADPKELASATGLSVKETKRLKRKAKEFLEAEAAQDAET